MSYANSQNPSEYLPYWPGPHLPDMPTQTMPHQVFDDQVQNVGLRFGWMKSHSCPCTYAINGKWGTPNPACQTCGGRGVYWDAPVSFSGLLTYMHTQAAPDEPGAVTSETLGHMLMASPVITIPWQGPYPDNENVVWNLASTFDAYVEYDATTRYDSVLVAGSQQVLPYQWGVKILAVAAYATGVNAIAPVASGNYSYSNGVVTLSSLVYPPGTAYTVEYTACPILVAFDRAGGYPHARPFAQGRSAIPRRFHLKALDGWLRDRFGNESPGSGTVPLVPWNSQYG